MNIPEEFTERLQERFHGKYRIRWSDARSEYHLEQRVRRGLAEGTVSVAPTSRKRWKERADDYIRARDGYILTMAIAPGTRTYCLECNSQMAVPAFETKQIKCEFCARKGRKRYQNVGYYPLGDTLLDHLAFIDAGSGGTERIDQAIERDNAFLLHDLQMTLRRRTESATRERFNRLVGIPQFGFKGADKFRHRTSY